MWIKTIKSECTPASGNAFPKMANGLTNYDVTIMMQQGGRDPIAEWFKSINRKFLRPKLAELMKRKGNKI